jgi:hypothetical protein
MFLNNHKKFLLNKMQIKVLVDEIDNEQIQKIVEHYNSNKQPHEEPLQILDRCEGGFKIQISYMKNQMCNENDKIKQLRWHKKYLTSQTYIDFKYKEKMLLFEALVNVLGRDNVLCEE